MQAKHFALIEEGPWGMSVGDGNGRPWQTMTPSSFVQCFISTVHRMAQSIPKSELDIGTRAQGLETCTTHVDDADQRYQHGAEALHGCLQAPGSTAEGR